MKRVIFLSILLCLAIGLSAQNAVAYLSANRGRVEMFRQNRQVRFRAGEMLQHEDQIRTGNDSYAAYRFIDGSSQVRIFANSNVRIRAAVSNGTLAKNTTVTRGRVHSNVSRNTGSYRVETATTVASVRGTEFLTDVDEEDNSRFIVVDGTVAVTIKATGETQMVGRGKTAVVDKDGNVEVGNSSEEDLEMLAAAADAAGSQPSMRTIMVPVQNEAGQIKYIEIRY